MSLSSIHSMKRKFYLFIKLKKKKKRFSFLFFVTYCFFFLYIFHHSNQAWHDSQLFLASCAFSRQSFLCNFRQLPTKYTQEIKSNTLSFNLFPFLFWINFMNSHLIMYSILFFHMNFQNHLIYLLKYIKSFKLSAPTT